MDQSNASGSDDTMVVETAVTEDSMTFGKTIDAHESSHSPMEIRYDTSLVKFVQVVI